MGVHCRSWFLEWDFGLLNRLVGGTGEELGVKAVALAESLGDVLGDSAVP